MTTETDETNDERVDLRKHRQRKPRNKTGRKNPAASEALKKKWQDPEYRAKQTKHNREVMPKGRRTRAGVPDGMTWAEAEPLWAKAEAEAEATMARFERLGQIEFDPTNDEDMMAREALLKVMSIALSPLRNKQLVIQAASTVLTFTRPKPRKELQLSGCSTAEEWLLKIVAEQS